MCLQVFQLAAERLGGPALLASILPGAAWGQIGWHEAEARLYAAAAIAEDVSCALVSEEASGGVAQAAQQVLQEAVQLVTAGGLQAYPMAARASAVFLAAYSAWIATEVLP